MKSLRKMYSRFGRDESGVLMAEAIIVLPFMLWSYLALFVYWDAFRSVNTVQKAAYTISDMISREMVTLPTNYVTGMRDLMRYLIDGDQTVKIRVTSVTWSDDNSRFEVDWSRSPDNAMVQLTTTTIDNFAYRIPKMADGDRVIIVETEVSYHPAFNVGMDDEVIKQFVVTRPRFIPKLCMTGVTCS
ncbi:MAG: TadE/TadG family type IV pilus assembly protein [Cypionkella sp.]|uniref:TadE/TadG family type IV pilus assembly protein n=1 Tax=Cypionkella sp. TaxID=2811411 RepID=UPI002ABC3364|nr:TadE/TadG family type IV pilus assembly protein [Cypionkella sp.]MDZ4309333.1 TadE/TadG family type IV pilus assembly protein [Cypionkella sp.]MDZ4395299.1 TadE/TadG family type IV pilus assembly protein [Cypionkella sp.]